MGTPASANENDFSVFGPYVFEGVTRVTIDVETDRNVIVLLMDHNGNQVELLFSEICPFEGSTTTSQEGVGLVYLKVEEGWTLTLERG